MSPLRETGEFIASHKEGILATLTGIAAAVKIYSGLKRGGKIRPLGSQVNLARVQIRQILLDEEKEGGGYTLSCDPAYLPEDEMNGFVTNHLPRKKRKEFQNRYLDLYKKKIKGKKKLQELFSMILPLSSPTQRSVIGLLEDLYLTKLRQEKVADPDIVAASMLQPSVVRGYEGPEIVGEKTANEFLDEEPLLMPIISTVQRKVLLTLTDSWKATKDGETGENWLELAAKGDQDTLQAIHEGDEARGILPIHLTDERDIIQIAVMAQLRQGYDAKIENLKKIDELRAKRKEADPRNRKTIDRELKQILNKPPRVFSPDEVS